jgi:hypothetical protein
LLIAGIKYWCQLTPAIFLGIALNACESNLAVPAEIPIEGCYRAGGTTLQLSEGIASSGKTLLARYRRGADSSGSFLVFTPAVRASNEGEHRLFIYDGLPQNHVVSILKGGRVMILMPGEPDGLVEFTKTNCI